MRPTNRRHVIVPVFLVCLVFIPAALSATAQEQAPRGTTNFSRIDAAFSVGGATTPEAMAELKKLGFASVINLRSASEPGAMVEEEGQAAREAGLKYFNIPMAAGPVQEATVAAFLKAVSDPANQPVYFHCARAVRASAIWTIKRVVIDGWPKEKALAEAEKLGLVNPALRQAVVDYLAKRTTT